MKHLFRRAALAAALLVSAFAASAQVTDGTVVTGNVPQPVRSLGFGWNATTSKFDMLRVGPATSSLGEARVYTPNTSYTITMTPTITSGSAYATGNFLGTKATNGALFRPGVGSGRIRQIVVTDASKQISATNNLDVYFFSAAVIGTVTDKAAADFGASDLAALQATVNVATNCKALATISTCTTAPGLNIPFKLSSNTAGFAFVVNGTPTFTSTSAVNVTVNFELE